MNEAGCSSVSPANPLSCRDVPQELDTWVSPQLRKNSPKPMALPSRLPTSFPIPSVLLVFLRAGAAQPWHHGAVAVVAVLLHCALARLL